MGLSARQRKFAEVYDGNGTAACRAAGYRGSDAVLATQAGRLLRNAEIVELIRAREVKAIRPAIATREERQRFWTEVMQSDAEMRDRLKASELLGKSEADFTERLEHSADSSFADALREARERARSR